MKVLVSNMSINFTRSSRTIPRVCLNTIMIIPDFGKKLTSGPLSFNWWSTIKQQLAGPGAVGIANLLEVADDADYVVDSFDSEDGKARPSSSSSWKPSWSSNKNKRQMAFYWKRWFGLTWLVIYCQLLKPIKTNTTTQSTTPEAATTATPTTAGIFKNFSTL